ncbi:MAG TPA: ATP-binding protein [Kofleriaceae bacterium]|nr:ATP-binding protein [Kofleriaceae bacterium]
MPALVDLGSQRRYPIGERLTIGRAAGCDIVVDDAMVSRLHAEIVLDGRRWLVRDLGSRRGTFVGHRRVGVAALDDGAELLIGPSRLRFERGDAEADGPDALTAAAEREELRRLRAVVELGRAIGVEHDLDRLLERVLATCFQLLRADRGAIIVYPPQSRTPCATIARDRRGAPVASALSTAVLSQIMSTQEPYLRTERDGELELARSASLSAQGVRSLMAVPLVYDAGETEWLGVIQLDSQATNAVFGPRDLELLVAIASQAALAIKNVMLVRRVQAVQSADWRRLERVVTNLPVGVIVLDEERRCVLVNPWVTTRARTIGALVAGAQVAQVAGIPCDRLVGGDLREQVTVGSPERAYTVAAHTAAEGGETVIVMTDITDERDRQTKAAHREKLALVGQLAGGIAHDFNNLLFVIMNNASFLEDVVTDSEDKDAAATIVQASRQAADLVAQLLTFSRREMVKPKVVDVGTLVGDMEPVLRRALGEQHRLSISAVEGARVLIDPSQLEQVVMNLVVNARDALPARGELSIAVGTLETGGAGRVTLEVVDDGSGMPPDVLARIFEPYFTTKPQGKGSGLGLATVYGIVQQAGGEITVRSEAGRGTRFLVSLPATDLALEATSVTRAGVARGRIMLVEDDEAVRRLTERMLARAGFEVVCAGSGPDALELSRTCGRLDLLITDMVMPGMSGRDLAHELVRESPDLRVLFMSGYHHGTPIPGWQFIGKPFDRGALVAKVGDALAPLAPATSEPRTAA